MRSKILPLKIIAGRVFYHKKLCEEGKFDPKEIIKSKVNLGFNAEHFSIDAKGISISKLKEILPEYLKVANEYNFKVFIYVNVHWYDLSGLKEHPDWFQVDYNGKIITDVYGKGLMPCVNSPGWRKFSIDNIAEIAKLNPHGIFLDGPLFHPRGCYCKYCVEKFRARYGIDPPIKGNLQDRNHLKLVEFQQDSMAEYMREVYERVKEVNEKVLVYMNGEKVRPNWATGRDNLKLVKYQDLIGAEGGFEYYNLLESPFFNCSMTAKFLEAQAPNKPRVIFIAAKHSPWNHEALTPAELKLRCAQTLANGAYYWIGYTCEDPELEKAMKEINSWIDGNEEYFIDTENIAKIGLYWSQLTANVYGGEVPVSDFTGRTIRFVKDYLKSFIGAYELLLRVQQPFKIIVKPEQIKELDILILSNVACLEEYEVHAIKEFVNKGGVLITSFETSLYTKYGEKCNNFILSELFGVDYLGIEEYNGFENYMVFENGRYMPCYTYVVKTKIKEGKTIAYLTENTKGWYQPLVISQYPAIVENKYGKGKVIYFAGNVFQTFANYKFKSYINFFKNLIKDNSNKIIETNAPLSIEINLRKKQNIIELHLVNFTSELMRPIVNIIPLHNLTFNLDISNVKEVFNIINKNAEVKWRYSNSKLTISLSELREYEVVILRT